MPEQETNFACLMDLLGVTSSDIYTDTGADKTLVSRWRSGKRRLMPGRHWADELAACFIKADEEYGYNLIPEILALYYPGEPIDTPEQRADVLARWLTGAGQQRPDYSKERKIIFAELEENIRKSHKPCTGAVVAQASGGFYENTVAYGVRGAQECALQAAGIVLKMTEPVDILFVCPEGLDMYTRDKDFGPRLMDMLMRIFEAGHRMSVVLRTDYRMTDVSAFSGRWLLAHLLGYIQSYYYDEFHKTYNDKMMAVIGNRMAYRVCDTGGGTVTSVYFDKPDVDKIRAECEHYRAQSKQRFHYSLFEQPDGYLQGVQPLPDRAHYQFARLPHFCLAGPDRFGESFQLSNGEMEFIAREFPLILSHPRIFDNASVIRHIFCEDDIEDALLKSRHMSQELSAITGRRISMSTQRLAEQLTLIKTLLAECSNYEVCFLPERVFKKLTMQIAAWGDTAAIGWIAGGKSTACRDYTNCNALTGFCGMVWEQVPAPLRLRRTAIRKLNIWLKKARKYGLDV